MNEKMRDAAEAVLVEEAKTGRIEAYVELVRRGVQERIYRTIFGMTRNHEDADDLTQETFMYAYKALGSFKSKSSFYTWAYRIAVNLSLNFLKKKGREKGREDFEDNAAVFGRAEYAALSPEGDSLNKELQDKLQDAIESFLLFIRPPSTWLSARACRTEMRPPCSAVPQTRYPGGCIKPEKCSRPGFGRI